MGLFDKLKNVFFEEEYVEVDEEISRKEVKKPEKIAVAKKIDLPNAKKVEEEHYIEEKNPEEEVAEEEKEFRFPMEFDDKDFKLEDSFVIEKRVDKKTEMVEEVLEEPLYEQPIYSATVLYEGGEAKRQRDGFKPSPIISPIYGVLDKNYKKDEIVAKREIRLSSGSGKMDLDKVREKAYGDLVSDISASMFEEEKEETEEEPLFYDLNDDEQPAVKNVTVGDAEEYFSELGLEYNIDYKVDANNKPKEVAMGRRTKIEEEITDEIEEIEEIIDDKDNSDSLEENLFDLIDSMYEDKE